MLTKIHVLTFIILIHDKKLFPIILESVYFLRPTQFNLELYLRVILLELNILYINK